MPTDTETDSQTEYPEYRTEKRTVTRLTPLQIAGLQMKYFDKCRGVLSLDEGARFLDLTTEEKDTWLMEHCYTRGIIPPSSNIYDPLDPSIYVYLPPTDVSPPTAPLKIRDYYMRCKRHLSEQEKTEYFSVENSKKESWLKEHCEVHQAPPALPPALPPAPGSTEPTFSEPERTNKFNFSEPHSTRWPPSRIAAHAFGWSGLAAIVVGGAILIDAAVATSGSTAAVKAVAPIAGVSFGAGGSFLIISFICAGVSGQ